MIRSGLIEKHLAASGSLEQTQGVRFGAPQSLRCAGLGVVVGPNVVGLRKIMSPVNNCCPDFVNAGKGA